MARVMLKPVAAAVSLLLPAAAHADPVSLIVAVASYALPAGVAFAVSVGASLLGAAATRRKQKKAAAAQRAQYNASLQERTVTVMNTEAPWQIVYGSPAPFAGAIVAIFTSGSRDEFKHLVYVFAAHECEAIDEVYVEGEAVGPLDADGWCTQGAFYETSVQTTSEFVEFGPSGVATVSNSVNTLLSVTDTLLSGENATFYTGTASGNQITISPAPGSGTTALVTVSYTYTQVHRRINIQKHLSPGGVDTADAFLMARVPDKWTSAHKLSGYTYLVVTLDLNLARFQGGPPNITIKARGKKLYDWRTGTSIYSANPALARADFIMGEYGFGASLSQIEAASAIASANACDVTAYTPSDANANSTALYRVDGVFTTDQDRESTLQQLEDACAGVTHESGGVWRILAGYWAAPVMALTEADALGPVTVEQASYSSRDRFNGARGTYVDWRNLGVSGDFPPYANATFVADDGIARNASLSLPFTHSVQRATQLARVTVEKSRGGLVLRWPGHMRLWPLQPGDRVTVTYSELGISGKNFRVSDWGFDLRSPVGLELIEDEPSFYDLADEVSTDAAPNTGLPDPFAKPAAPAQVTAESGTDQLVVQADGSILTRVLVSWPAPGIYVASGGEVHLRWRPASSTADWQTQVLDGNARQAYISGEPDGIALLIGVRYVQLVGSLKVASDWTTIAHTVVGKTEPPNAISAFSATQELLFFTLPSDIDLAGARFRSLPGVVPSPAFSRGTDILSGLVLSSPARMERRLYGVQTLMAVAEDTSGNQSVVVSTVLDFGQPDTDAAVWDADLAAGGFVGTYTACTLSAGQVLADLQADSNLYALDNVYGEPDVYAALYQAMVWQSEVLAVPLRGTLVLDSTTAGNAVVIDYRVSGDASIDLYSAADVYALADAYGGAGEWAPWPGALDVRRLTPIEFRVSISASAEQGAISAFTASLLMEDVQQTFDASIDPAGTRLTPSAGSPPRSWVGDIQVSGIPFVDGSGAIGFRVLDYSPTLGPLIQAVNNIGAAVAGRGRITVEGNSDE